MAIKQEKLTIIVDGVTTIVYASAVNVVIAGSIGSINGIKISVPFALGIILFMFVDWLCRILVPRSFPSEKDQLSRKEFINIILKALLEIACIFIFLSASVRILNSGTDINRLFASYLLLTFGWSLLMLWEMKNLSWWELMMGVIKGSVYNLEGTSEYTIKLKEGIKNTKKKARESTTDGESLKNFERVKNQLFKCGGGRMLFQLLACHVAFANVVIGLLLFFERTREHFFNSQFYVSNLGDIWWIRGIILFLILGLPSFLFYEYENMREKNENTENTSMKIIRMIAGISGVVFLIMFYTAFDMNDIKYVIIVQQVIFSVVILYAVPKENNEQSTQSMTVDVELMISNLEKMSDNTETMQK